MRNRKQQTKKALMLWIISVFFAVVLASGGMPFFARADSININGQGISSGAAQDAPQTAQEYLGKLYDFLLGIVGVAAMGSIVYGGVLYVVSAGNPSRVSSAKDAIWNGIIGILVAGFGYLILITINPDLAAGFDLENIVKNNLNKTQQQ